MRLATASLDALQAAIATWRPDAIVSAFSPSQPMQAPWGGPWLPLAFHDVEGLGHRGPALYPGRPIPSQARPGSFPGAPVTLPALAHVEALVAWMKAHRPTRLLVTCRAGLGRSPALAIVAAIASGIPALDAVRAIAEAVPEASPNRLILRHAEVVLGVAILRHAEGAWDYRRGARGARGDATGLRPTPPYGSSPRIPVHQAAPGAALRVGQTENGVPTPGPHPLGSPPPASGSPPVGGRP